MKHIMSNKKSNYSFMKTNKGKREKGDHVRIK